MTSLIYHKNNHFNFNYCGRYDVDIHNINNFKTEDVPSFYVYKNFRNTTNFFLFLSKSDLYPLIIFEAIENNILIIVLMDTDAHRILKNMFRGFECFLVIESLSDLKINQLIIDNINLNQSVLS